jgi:hypothetical protein
MNKIIRKIIKYLYWKFKCNQDESWAHQMLLYIVPKNIRAKKACFILAQIESNIIEQVNKKQISIPDSKISLIGINNFPENKPEIVKEKNYESKPT